MDAVIQGFEKGERDIIIISERAIELNWIFKYPHSYQINSQVFDILTNNRYQDSINAEGLHKLLNDSNVKYIVRMNNEYKDFFFKLDSIDDYYQKVYDQDIPEIPEKKDVQVWKLK